MGSSRTPAKKLANLEDRNRVKTPNWSRDMMKIESYIEELRSEDLLRRQRLKSLGAQRRSASKRPLTLISIGPVKTEPMRDRSKGYRTPEEIAALNRANQASMGMVPLAEKRSGVMTAGFKDVPGRRYIIQTSTAMSPPPPHTQVVTTVQAATAYRKILDRVASVDGNHKTPNNHTFRTRRYDFGSGYSYAGGSRNNTVISGTEVVSFGFVEAFTDRKNFVYNEALDKLYENIRGDVDLSVDAFQARQAGVMLNQRFQQGRNLFLKKAPFALMEVVAIAKRMKRSNPRDWGSLWLEWTYGWKPLAGSIYGATQNMIESSRKVPGSVTGHPVRAQASEKGDSYSISSVDGQGVMRTRSVESIYQARFIAFYALTNGGLNGVAGYTSLNPVSIAWELVPYSFVADWLVNIGGYLRNMESGLLYNSDFVSGYRTERSRQTERQTAGGGNASYSVNAAGSVEIKEFARTVSASSPLPRPPTFNAKLGTSRLISAASLLAQQLRSFKR
jgi:hypothetical protein